MEQSGFVKWMRRIALGATITAVAGVLVAMWIFSSILARDLLTPATAEIEFDLEVATVRSGSISLTRTPLTELDGVWGLQSEDAYGQVTAVIEVRDDVVERAFRPIAGEFREGDRVRFEEYAFAGTPVEAHGIGFEIVPVAGELGVLPAWRVDGVRTTWVIVIHGEGEGRGQGLRILPALQEQGYPVLMMTYRNDVEASPAADGRFSWGREEWRDVEDAVTYVRLLGAEEIVLYGHAMGGEIAAMFLHESELVGDVVGVVLDSPVLDLEAVVDAMAVDRGIPGFVASGAKALVTLRFDVDWRELDQIERAAEFDVPILLLHGEADERAPVSVSDAFAAARPDIVTYERFAGVGHGFSWNADPIRYEAAVADFLTGVSAPLE
jgi:pimeloyl-ACP methyl ester carboxylesterase